MTRKFRRALPSLLALSLLYAFAPAARAQASGEPTNVFDYARTVDYEYDTLGQLKTMTVEKDTPALCVQTAVIVDGYGNTKKHTTSNCASATGRLVFSSRSSSGDFTAVASQPITVGGVQKNVAISAGIFQPSVKNALDWEIQQTIDPRFGLILSKKDVGNNRTTTFKYDDFGRLTSTVENDGSSQTMLYCILPTTEVPAPASNSAGCPTPSSSEVPSNAVSFTHSETLATNGAKKGPFVRIYADSLGRTVRTVTEGFDGANQKNGLSGALTVADTVYSTYGVKTIETGRYFLTTGAAHSGYGPSDKTLIKYDYDARGRQTAIYTADPNGSANTSFGSYGTLKAAKTAFRYEGAKATTINDTGLEKSQTSSPTGAPVLITDPNGAQLALRRDAFDNVIGVRDALGNTIGQSYDKLGHLTKLDDPDTGVTVNCYDPIGLLKASQTSNARGNNTVGAAPYGCPEYTDTGAAPTAYAKWTTYSYDKQGRQVGRMDDYLSRWFYDKDSAGASCGGGQGLLCQATTNTGLNKRFNYDTMGRLLAARQDLDATNTLAFGHSYESTTGRIQTTTYPTGLRVSYQYTNLGYPSSMTLDTAITGASGKALAAGTVLWKTDSQGADGSFESGTFANGVVANNGYQSGTGRLTLSQAGPVTSAVPTIVDQSYSWDSLGNLLSRSDNIGNPSTGGVSETFQYDNLNRLSAYQVGSAALGSEFQRTTTLSFNAIGSLLAKSDLGTYRYGTSGQAQPHVPKTVAGSTFTPDAHGNILTADAGKYRTFTYTQFNRVATAAGPAGGPQYTWAYDELQQRVKETRVNAEGTRTLTYLHPAGNLGQLLFEREELAGTSPYSQNRHFLGIGGTTQAVITTGATIPSLGNSLSPTFNSTLAGTNVEFWHKDHLGSLIATSDSNGAATDRYAYDPFGKNRDTNGSYDASGALRMDWRADGSGASRGFTGHEQRDDLGIVNMNGRIFDASMGLFIQADSKVPDPSNLQSYNRYGYAHNNPLNATDPSGFDNWGAETSPSGQAGLSYNEAYQVFGSMIGPWPGLNSPQIARFPASAFSPNSSSYSGNALDLGSGTVSQSALTWWLWGFMEPGMMNLWPEEISSLKLRKDWYANPSAYRSGKSWGELYDDMKPVVAVASLLYGGVGLLNGWATGTAEVVAADSFAARVATEKRLSDLGGKPILEESQAFKLKPVETAPPSPPQATTPPKRIFKAEKLGLQEQTSFGPGEFSYRSKDFVIMGRSEDGGVVITDIYKYGNTDVTASEATAAVLRSQKLTRPLFLKIDNILNPETIAAFESGASAEATLLGRYGASVIRQLGGTPGQMERVISFIGKGDSIIIPIKY
jgi:RHS repeat-associated protein